MEAGSRGRDEEQDIDKRGQEDLYNWQLAGDLHSCMLMHTTQGYCSFPLEAICFIIINNNTKFIGRKCYNWLQMVLSAISTKIKKGLSPLPHLLIAGWDVEKGFRLLGTISTTGTPLIRAWKLQIWEIDGVQRQVHLSDKTLSAVETLDSRCTPANHWARSPKNKTVLTNHAVVAASKKRNIYWSGKTLKWKSTTNSQGAMAGLQIIQLGRILSTASDQQQPGWIIIDNDYFDQPPMTSYSHKTFFALPASFIFSK